MRASARLARCLLLLLLALALLGPGPRAARAAGDGAIEGEIDGADRPSAAFAIDRAAGRKYPGTVDPSTGRFAIGGLPLGGRYDCVIDLPGARLEGIDLRVPPAEPEAEDEDPPALSAEDEAVLRAQVRRLNQFEDEVQVLAISGNGRHAAVLLNKLRTRPFVNSKPGEVVWRAELWHFDRPEETWIKSLDELFVVLYRERLAAGAYREKSITFDPALGGLSPTPGQPAVRLGRVARPAAGPGIRLRDPGATEGKGRG